MFANIQLRCERKAMGVCSVHSFTPGGPTGIRSQASSPQHKDVSCSSLLSRVKVHVPLSPKLDYGTEINSYPERPFWPSNYFFLPSEWAPGLYLNMPLTWLWCSPVWETCSPSPRPPFMTEAFVGSADGHIGHWQSSAKSLSGHSPCRRELSCPRLCLPPGPVTLDCFLCGGVWTRLSLSSDWATPRSSPALEVRMRLAEVLVTILSSPQFLPLPCCATFSSPQLLLTSRAPPNSPPASNLCARVCHTDHVQRPGLLSNWEHWFPLPGICIHLLMTIIGPFIIKHLLKAYTCHALTRSWEHRG